jgi:hypothetical protein
MILLPAPRTKKVTAHRGEKFSRRLESLKVQGSAVFSRLCRLEAYRLPQGGMTSEILNLMNFEQALIGQKL